MVRQNRSRHRAYLYLHYADHGQGHGGGAAPEAGDIVDHSKAGNEIPAFLCISIRSIEIRCHGIILLSSVPDEVPDRIRKHRSQQRWR